MGHHLTEKGYFQSDKHPELPENKIILDFKDKHAQEALLLYADLTEDEELAVDIITAIGVIMQDEYDQKKEATQD